MRNRSTVTFTLSLFTSLIFITSSLVTPVTSNQNLQLMQELGEPITGFQTPFINGIIERNGVVNQLLDEWEDAKFSQIEFKSNNGFEILADQYRKTVRDNLYIGLIFHSDLVASSISNIVVQIDRDADEVISNGDVQLVLNQLPIDNNGQLSFHELTHVVQSRVYDTSGNGWTDFNTHDPGQSLLELSTGATWGSIMVSSVSQGQKLETHLEFEIDLFQIEQEFSNQFPSDRSNHRTIEQAKLETIGYGIGIETFNSGVFGFPSEPIVDLNSPDPLELASTAVIVYDVIEYDYLPSIDLGIDWIELTQSTQTKNNDYTVVEGKESLLRVFVKHDLGFLTQVRVIVEVYHFFLFREDLVFTSQTLLWANPNPRRQVYNHSANFYLGPQITNSSTLVVKARVEPVNAFFDPNQADNRVIKPFFTRSSRNINFYYVPVNNGTILSPDTRVSDGRADWFKLYTEKILPSNEVNFVRLGWATFGRWDDTDGQFRALNFLYNSLIAQYRSMIRSGGAMLFPHQLHSVNPFGGGEADANWAGGQGNVAYNGWGTSGPLTMVHEANHNWGDETRPGRHEWGRHVTGDGYGCGAGTAIFSDDSDWDALYGDNIIHDIGWNVRDKIFHAGYTELMTYCISAWPNKWIGGYRWEIWYDYLQTIEGDTVRTASDAVVTPLPFKTMSLAAPGVYEPSQQFTDTVRTVSGWVDSNGNSILFPSFEIQGLYNHSEDFHNILNPTYELRIKYANGSDFHIPLQPIYTSTDGPDRDQYHFDQLVPDNGEVISIVLYDLGNNLEIQRQDDSQAFLQGSLQYQQFAKQGELIQISNDIVVNNATNLHFQLIYTPDNIRWFPIGQSTTSTDFDVAIQGLPGGDKAQFYVLVSDGLKTQMVTGPLIDIEHPQPSVEILNSKTAVRNPSFIPQDIDSSFILVENLLNSSVGSTMSFKAIAHNEMGLILPDGSYHWRVADSFNNLVTETINGELMFKHRFSKPGKYRVSVSATDPTSGLFSEDFVDVEIFSSLAMGTPEDLQKFNSGLLLARDSQQTTSDSISSTKTESSTRDSESEKSANLPLPYSPDIIVVSILLITIKAKGKRIRTLN